MNIFDVIKGHVESEKTRELGDLYNSLNMRTKGMTPEVGKKHVFQVDPRANKHQIRLAVEEMYKDQKVKVAKVNTVSMRGKTKRGRTTQAGKKSDWKKAIVTLAEGEIKMA